MPTIQGGMVVPDGPKCSGGGSQCDNYEETSFACYLFGQKIADCNKCPECLAACAGS